MALDHMVLTLQEVKNYLRVEHAQDDDLILLYIETAKEKAEQMCNYDFTEIDEEGVVITKTIPSSVKTACLRMIASWYRHRDDSTETESLGDRSVNVGEVPWNIQSMLFQFRKNPGM